MSGPGVKEEVNSMIEDLQLVDKDNQKSSALSGGQKRKLRYCMVVPIIKTNTKISDVPMPMLVSVSVSYQILILVPILDVLKDLMVGKSDKCSLSKDEQSCIYHLFHSKMYLTSCTLLARWSTLKVGMPCGL